LPLVTRVASLAVVVGLVGLVDLTGCSSPPPSSPIGLAVHQPTRVLDAKRLDRVAADEELDLVLGMRLPDRARLKQLVAQPGGPGLALSPSEFGARFALDATSYEGSARWLEAQGLTVTRRTDSRTTLSVHGTAGVVESALGVELWHWQDASGIFRAPGPELRALAPGGALAATVDVIVGLDDAVAFRPRSHRPPPPASPHFGSGPLTATDLRTIYNVEGTLNPATGTPYRGEGETVAILGSGNPPSPTRDVAKFITTSGLNSGGLHTSVSAQYTRVFVGGPTRSTAAQAANEYTENVLDVDMVFSIAPHVDIVHVFTATNAIGLFSDGVAFVINNVPHAHAVSLSFGLCERFSGTEAVLLDSLFTQALAQGQTWFSASGDNGTDGCQDGAGNKVLSVDWPSASPHVVGVGGTALSGSVEIGWFGSGGGLSELFERPAFQTNVGPYPTVNSRNVPDVSALAGDPAVATVENGGASSAEGTSAAAPMWAAVWALLHQSRNHVAITDSLDHLYQVGAATSGTATPAFNDLITGNNAGPGSQGYSATAGYDLVTGWGSPNVPNLLAKW